ncbi:hypothetical protein HCU40_12265 [Pseudanabaena biceps]|nr:hypothetical protein [Pseudanabaena biceps]
MVKCFEQQRKALLATALYAQTRTKKFFESVALQHFQKISCGSFDRKLLYKPKRVAVQNAATLFGFMSLRKEVYSSLPSEKLDIAALRAAMLFIGF